MSFIFTGTSALQPPSLLIDNPLRATTTSGPFSAETEVRCWLSSELFSQACPVERRILRSVWGNNAGRCSMKINDGG